MKNLALLIILFLIVVAVAGISKFNIKDIYNPQAIDNNISNGSIGNQKLQLEIANNASPRALGLSGRESLEDGSGMLFVFPEVGKYGFWMKDMNFPIDIIWINNEMRVVGVEKNIAPDTYPDSFYPPGDIKYALEVPGGYFDKYSLKIDDALSLESQNKILEGTF